VRVLSDLRVSHPEERRHGLPHGMLKAVLLNEDVCVCLAGSVAVGAPAVAELARRGTRSGVDRVVTALYEAHQRHPDRTQFLVVCRDPIRFWKISDGAIEENKTSAWIGDHAAFSRFQELSLGPPLSPRFKLPREIAVKVDPEGDRDDLVQQMDAFRAVIGDQTIETVGDARVVVRGDDAAGFSYLPYMEMDNGLNPPAVHSAAGEEVNLLRAGSAAVGAYAYSLLVPVTPGLGAVGVHVLQANVGFFYYPAFAEDAVVYRSVDVHAFVAVVAADHGVELTGILFAPAAG
jgi:hypothetical protein